MNIAWAPDSKRFAFNFPQPAARVFYETVAFYQLHGDKWEMLESLAKANPISKAISKAISGGLAVDRTRKHKKSKTTAATEIVAKDGEETGKTIRADFLFTLKFDKAGKLKIVRLSNFREAESQKYQQDSHN